MIEVLDRGDRSRPETSRQRSTRRYCRSMFTSRAITIQPGFLFKLESLATLEVRKSPVNRDGSCRTPPFFPCSKLGSICGKNPKAASLKIYRHVEIYRPYLRLIFHDSFHDDVSMNRHFIDASVSHSLLYVSRCFQAKVVVNICRVSARSIFSFSTRLSLSLSLIVAI